MNKQTLKRPPKFGEGFDVKRPRTEPLKEVTGGDKDPLGGLFCGSDFNTKPAPPVLREKKPWSKTILTGAKELKPVLQNKDRTLMQSKNKATRTFLSPRTLPVSLSSSETKLVKQKELERPYKLTAPGIPPLEAKKGSPLTPLRPVVCPPLLLKTPDQDMFLRKVVPFHKLMTPTLDISKTSTHKMKPVPSPNFDLSNVSRKPTNMVSMTALEPPKFDLPEAGEDESKEKVELKRGLEVSPHKVNGRVKRFVRGGLAELAHQQINRSNTSLVLWRKELQGYGSRTGRLRPDLRLQIVDVTQVSRNMHPRSNDADSVRSILAICETGEEKKRQKVSFFFSPGQDSGNNFSEGKLVKGTEVLVWKPWSECGTGDNAVLFCSRFVVMT